MKKGFFYLAMALLAFAGIGLEVILAFGLEPVLYGAELKDWTVSQNIIHWILTCILWGASAFGVITLAKKKGDFDIFQKEVCIFTRICIPARLPCLVYTKA